MIINVHRIKRKVSQKKSTFLEILSIRIKKIFFVDTPRKNAFRKPLRGAMIVY